MARDLRKVLTGGLLVLGAAVPVLLAVEATHQRACDRACLLAITNSYVAALLAHDPSAVAVAPDLKTTRNGVASSLGEGLWKTAKTVSSRQSFADPYSGEAAFFGVVTEENGHSSRLALHLKIDRQQIQEVETVVSPEEAAR